jgi:DNA-directed RNA polymerase I and III subunit RPAC1
VEIHQLDELEMEFDLVGVDASIANAFRRILLAEVPTMSIETVYMYNNTSVIQDEVLSHRLGLVPINADPTRFGWQNTGVDGKRLATDFDTLAFKLHVKCEKNHSTETEESDPHRAFKHANVYSRDIQWIPKGKQSVWFENTPVKPVHDNILIAKLRPGQEIELEMHAVKGIGKDHAKFSPVATASYRLLPTIQILSPIVNDDAEKFVACFPKGVAKVKADRRGVKHAEIVNPRLDTVSREVLRHDEFKDKIRLGRVRDHFIFSIESTGILHPDNLFLQSISVLRGKCQKLKSEIEANRHVL